MPAPNLEVVVGGRLLSLDVLYGDVEMSTVWPGGSDELSWAMDSQPTVRFVGGENVTALFAGVPVWAGSLVEPDSSQDRLTAVGAWHEADTALALTNAGATSRTVNAAIDQAILRGALDWTRPSSIAGSATDIDVSQGPVTVGALLDTWCENNTMRWGVTPTREVYVAADPTGPTYYTLPQRAGLGFALDDYASRLICRYFDSGSSTYETVTAVDAAAEADHGYREAAVDLTGRGSITAAAALAYGQSLLALGRSTPQWTASIELSYGELLTNAGIPVALEAVAAGQVVRIPGGADLASRKNGAMYDDVLVGQTTLSDGSLTLQPFRRATRTYQDFVTEALSMKK